MKVIELSITTDAAQDGSDTEALPLNAVYLLYAFEWIDGDFADGVDAVLACTGPSDVERTLLTLTDANADKMYYPRELEDDNAGAEGTTYTLPVVEGTVSLTVSSGGAIKTGKGRLHLAEV